MCISILASDSRFTEVKPRRPKGGPDGGRDIEAVHQGQGIVWGAVGFRNNANDSHEDKKWVERKFKSDLAEAKRQNPSLAGFVFFTNVDLTPSEVRRLEAHSKKSGVPFTDIFYRERLRIVLDSPTGLSLRYQYLQIPLTEAEQAAFFAHWGSQIERVLTEGFDAVDLKLKRLEFLHDCTKPLKGISLVIGLKQPYTPEQLGHFRLCAEILDLFESEPHPSLVIAGRDAYSTLHSAKQVQPLFGIQSIVWSQNPDERIQNTIVGGSLTTDRLDVGGHIYKKGPFKTLGDLDSRTVNIYMTKALLDKLAGVAITANGYLIYSAETGRLVAFDKCPLYPWPEELSDSEREIAWILVAVGTGEPSASESGWPPNFARWNLNYSAYTPEKLS